MTETKTPTGDRIATALGSVDYRRFALYAMVLFFTAFFLSPIWTGLVTSLKTDHAVTVTAPLMPPGPEGFTLNNYAGAIGFLGRGFINSLAMAIPSTFLDVLLGSTAAYGLTLVDWKYQIPVLITFIIGIFIPYQAILVPLADFWVNIFPLEKVLAPIWALPVLKVYHARLLELIITHVAYGIPICMLLFRSYYHTISDELIEAAKIDGASITSIYLRIVLPLSTPMIGVVLIYQFTQIWNEFLFSLTLIGSSSSPAATLTLILSGMGASISGVDFGLRMAGAFVTALPTILIYLLFSDQFAEGLRT
ncbi:MAG: carbohydrate ABC transporter permease [Halodesulfurarchaeum sp.]